MEVQVYIFTETDISPFHTTLHCDPLRSVRLNTNICSIFPCSVPPSPYEKYWKEGSVYKERCFIEEKYFVSVIFVDFCPFKAVTMQPQTLIADIKHNSGEAKLYAADSINSAAEIHLNWIR